MAFIHPETLIQIVVLCDIPTKAKNRLDKTRNIKMLTINDEKVILKGTADGAMEKKVEARTTGAMT